MVCFLRTALGLTGSDELDVLRGVLLFGDGVAVDIEVEQDVRILVDDRPNEIRVVLSTTNFDERLDVDEYQLLANALRFTAESHPSARMDPSYC